MNHILYWADHQFALTASFTCHSPCTRWAKWFRNRRIEYWATRSSVRSFARTAYSFACSGLLTSLAPSAALTRSLTPSLVGKRFFVWNERVDLVQFQPTVPCPAFTFFQLLETVPTRLVRLVLRLENVQRAKRHKGNGWLVLKGWFEMYRAMLERLDGTLIAVKCECLGVS